MIFRDQIYAKNCLAGEVARSSFSKHYYENSVLNKEVMPRHVYEITSLCIIIIVHENGGGNKIRVVVTEIATRVA